MGTRFRASSPIWRSKWSQWNRWAWMSCFGGDSAGKICGGRKCRVHPSPRLNSFQTLLRVREGRPEPRPDGSASARRPDLTEERCSSGRIATGHRIDGAGQKSKRGARPGSRTVGGGRIVGSQGGAARCRWAWRRSPCAALRVPSGKVPGSFFGHAVEVDEGLKRTWWQPGTPNPAGGCTSVSFSDCLLLAQHRSFVFGKHGVVQGVPAWSPCLIG